MTFFAVLTYTKTFHSGKPSETRVSAYAGQVYGKGFATEAVAVASAKRALSNLYPGAQFVACQFEDFAEAKEYCAMLERQANA